MMQLLTPQKKKKKKKKNRRILQIFLYEFIYFEPYYMIVYYQLSLFILNMGRCDYFILLNFYNIFIVIQLSLSICYCIYKIILN